MQNSLVRRIMWVCGRARGDVVCVCTWACKLNATETRNLIGLTRSLVCVSTNELKKQTLRARKRDIIRFCSRNQWMLLIHHAIRFLPLERAHSRIYNLSTFSYTFERCWRVLAHTILIRIRSGLKWNIWYNIQSKQWKQASGEPTQNYIEFNTGVAIWRRGYDCYEMMEFW